MPKLAVSGKEDSTALRRASRRKAQKNRELSITGSRKRSVSGQKERAEASSQMGGTAATEMRRGTRMGQLDGLEEERGEQLEDACVLRT